jgi:hypothetical protein
MTSTSDHQLVTAADAARILGITRRRMIGLAESGTDFPPPEPANGGGRRWPRQAVEARTFRYGLALRQYFIDRDGNPVLTADGRPVHLLVDEHGNRILDSEGRGIGPVEIPPGCRVEPAGNG